MKHLLLAVYVLLFTAGSSGIVALAIMSVREKSTVIRHLLKLQILYFTGLAAEIAYYYIRVIIDTRAEISAPFSAGFGAGINLIQAALYGASYLAVSTLKHGRLNPVPLQTCQILCLCVTAKSLCASAYFTASLFGAEIAFLRPVVFSGYCYILIAAALALLSFCLLTAPAVEETPSVRFLLRGWGMSILLFIPLTLFELLFNTSAASAPVSVNSVFFVCCSVASIIACIKSLHLSPVPQEMQNNIFFAYSFEVADCFALTARERELLPHIANGLANKEIAAALRISPATVRTHLYNLFQKTGAHSRIDLLNKLSGR